MLDGFRSLDRVLRGEATTPAALIAAGRRGLDVPVWALCVAVDLLGLGYGLCMGVFDLTAGTRDALKQTVSAMLKVPALLLLTLLVTLPSLYVFNALVGSRLRLGPMVRLLVATVGVMAAVLAGVGPIVAFFSFTTTSYPFMLLLNVLVFAVAGLLATRFLLQTLHRLAVIGIPPPTPVAAMTVSVLPVSEFSADEIPLADLAPAAGPLDRSTRGDHPLGRHVRTLFHVWVIVFGVVGAQMGYVLSPFLGHRGERFHLFRTSDSNFFAAVWENVHRLMQ